MESLWDGASTTTWEEHQKEEVLAVFRELAKESKGDSRVRALAAAVVAECLGGQCALGGSNASNAFDTST